MNDHHDGCGVWAVDVEERTLLGAAAGKTGVMTKLPLKGEVF